MKDPVMAALFTYLLHRPKTHWLAALCTLALVANTLATNWLTESYALSRFPVPYFQAQLSFNAAQLKGWYAQLVEWGTMDLYLRTQFIDHLFILTVLMLHVVALLWGSRLFPANHRGRRIMVGAALLSAIAPIADTLENLVSYVMLTDPVGFPDSLALLYSSLATIKFAMFTFAYVALTIGVVVGLAVRWRQRSARRATVLDA